MMAAAPVERPQDGGTASGRAHAVVLDELDRPITAGGFVEGARVVFEDHTAKAGLDGFRHRAGGPEKRYIIETKSGGAAVLDYDNDGWLDVYLPSASPWEALFGEAEHGISRLYRNNRDGTFSDVTSPAGVPNRAWAFGVVAGDYDNDGWTDLYVSNLGPNRLYHNRRDGTFGERAEEAGVVLEAYMTTGAAFGDFDRDGLLDLFVCGYAEFDPANPPRSGVDVPINFCRFRGVDVMCGPRGLPGTRDFLFRNEGDGTFTEMAESAGVHGPAGGYGFSPVWVDVDDDGWLDLVVANDSTPNYLYLNNRDGTFKDVSYVSGFALSQDGRSQAGMGLAVGDFNHDGRVDFYVSHFSDDYNTLYQNQGDSFFLDVSYEAGLGDPTIPFVSWGTAFLDYDNDGWQDLFLVNGHVYPAVDEHRWGTTWAQRPLLFRNMEGLRFEPVPAAPGSGLAILVVGRGAAFGDLDNDGRIDVVINALDSPPRLLRNVQESGNNWVKFRLVGGEKSPGGGIGAVLFLTVGELRQRRDVFTGGSFASSSDPRPHFGVGSAEKVDVLEIRWPSGTRQTLNDLPVNRIIEIREGKPSFRVLPVFSGGDP
jgi:enediyne biosynthesis protein E4